MSEDADATRPRTVLGQCDARDVAGPARPGRAASGLDELVQDLLNAQLLRMAIGASFGAEVSLGLAVREREATLSLAAHPPSDGRQLQAKKEALRSRATRDASGEPLAAMVAAALDHDERRIVSVETARAARRTHRPAQALVDAPRPGRSPSRTAGRRRATIADRLR